MRCAFSGWAQNSGAFWSSSISFSLRSFEAKSKRLLQLLEAVTERADVLLVILDGGHGAGIVGRAAREGSAPSTPRAKKGGPSVSGSAL